VNNKSENNSHEDGVSSSNEIVTVNDAEMRPPAVEELTEAEKRSFEENEQAIEKGSNAYWEAGKALMDIRDRQLYREQYSTFEAYCMGKWGFGKSQAYRHIDAVKTLAWLSPIGEVPKRLPGCESQIRPLVGLKPEEVKTAWNKAVAVAGEKPITAKIVEAEAAKFKTASETKKCAAAEKKAVAVVKVASDDKVSAQDEAFMNMDAAYRDLKKVKKLDESQKEEWTGLLNDIVETLTKLGVEVG